LAALIALAVAIVIAIFLFTMPAGLAIRASILGAVIGFFPIGWIVLNVIFMYRLTVATGSLRNLAAGDWRSDAGPSAAAALDRLRLWRVLRGSFRVWHAGCGDSGDPDRAWLLAARGVRAVADRPS